MMAAARRNGNVSRSLLACLALVMLSVTAASATPPEFDLRIEQSSLRAALDELARQTKLKIVAWDDPPDILSEPLQGRFTLDAAFDRLLAGSGLVHQKLDDGTYGLVFDTDDPASTDAGPPDTTEQAVGHTKPRAEDGVNDIVVTGSRLHRSDTGSPAPVRVYSQDQLQRFGAFDVSAVATNTSQHAYAGDGRHPNGAQYLDIRGLGVSSSLVLIDGRRVLSTAGDGVDAFDLRTIPVSAVERIEVFSESASAAFPAHGGGVVNIVLKKEIPTPSVELQYGSARGGSAERRISLATGDKTERWTSTVVMEYSDRNPLLGSERDLSSNQDFRRFGSADYRVTTSQPGNVSSASGQPLPGLDSSFAGIPTEGGTAPQDFLATAGQLNLESLSRYDSLWPTAQNSSLFASTKYQFPKLTASAELIYVRREVIQQLSPPILSAVRVPAENPFNPFGEPVVVDALLQDLGPRRSVRSSTWLRPVFGVRSDGHSWDWQVSVSRSMETGSMELFNDLDSAALSAALAQTDRAVAIDLFGAGGADNPASLASMRSSQVTPFSLTGTLLSASLEGQLRTLLGEGSVSVGGEWEQLTTSLDGESPAFRRQSSSSFAQTTIPLLHEQLRFTAGARLSHVTGFGTTGGPLYRLVWKPHARTSIHVSYIASVRPPSIPDLAQPRTAVRVPVSDPERQGEVAVVSVVTGGNPNLDLSLAKTFSTGIAFGGTHSKLSATYWRVTAQDLPTTPSIAQLFDHRGWFGGRIVRYPATATDLEYGRPGVLRLLDVSKIDGGLLDTGGVDLEASGNFKTGLGRLDADLTLTFVDRYVTAITYQAAPEDRAGIANPSGTILPWRMVGGIRWSGKLAELGMRARYIPSYEDFDVRPIERNIPAQTLLDLEIALNVDALLPGATALSPTKITFGAQNALDKKAPYAVVGGSWGFDRSQSDLVERFIYVRLVHEFG